MFRTFVIASDFDHTEYWNSTSSTITYHMFIRIVIAIPHIESASQRFSDFNTPAQVTWRGKIYYYYQGGSLVVSTLFCLMWSLVRSSESYRMRRIRFIRKDWDEQPWRWTDDVDLMYLSYCHRILVMILGILIFRWHTIYWHQLSIEKMSMRCLTSLWIFNISVSHAMYPHFFRNSQNARSETNQEKLYKHAFLESSCPTGTSWLSAILIISKEWSVHLLSNRGSVEDSHRTRWMTSLPYRWWSRCIPTCLIVWSPFTWYDWSMSHDNVVSWSWNIFDKGCCMSHTRGSSADFNDNLNHRYVGNPSSSTSKQTRYRCIWADRDDHI